VKTAPNRGNGDGVLSQYYQNVSGAYSNLGLTAEAVDAAAGGIISWGNNRQNRQSALGQLKNVLSSARDLDDYVAKLDLEVKKTGLENPIVRKAIGEVYYDNGKPERAEVQLRIAIENQPNDIETHRLLVAVYDKRERPDQALAQLLELAKLSGHDSKVYEEIGKRWAGLGKSGEAERAFTNIIEMLPNESEGHEALAKIRESQNRWEEAAAEWRQVIRARTKEPTGYIGLANTLFQMKRWAEAKKVTAEILKTDWPERFGDIKSQVREMELQARQNIR
jgi:tetratricopeptide (TPR) repeat protein